MDIAHAIQTLCVYAFPMIFAITLHESAHGWAAERLGDPTARSLGRVTVNPLPHIDMMGTIIVPGVTLLVATLSGMGPLLFGWAKPVPINPWNFRNPKAGMGVTAAAGPLSNLLQAVLWALLLKVLVSVGIHERFFLEVAVAGIQVNVVLMALNLIPLLPLDGGRIVRSVLPEKIGREFDKTERWGFMILLLLLAFNGLWYVVAPFIRAGQWVVNLIL